MTRPGRILIMTVGTGDIDRLEETLFTPLRKSIATDAWARVVLLPSKVTEEFAQALRDRLAGADVDISPLPAGDENDADAAYTHFDGVLGTVLQEAKPEEVMVDFTRGTKAMSAALVLAATRRAVPRLRYVAGTRRDQRGMVEPGSEVIREIQTTSVEGHRRLDLAREHLRRGAFAAVANVLPDPEAPLARLYPDDFLHAAKAVRGVARFHAAWDRLDYAGAAKLTVGEPPSEEWRRYWPAPDVRAWLTALARQSERSDHGAMAAWLRRLAVDLLANGERRVRQGQNEDALVRAYRLLELIGQARLFDQGLDSANLARDHDAVQAVQRESTKKKRPSFSESHGKLQASRFQVGRLLRRCGDPLAATLLRFEETASLNPTLRNNSVLVHGFIARAPDDPSLLQRLFRDLETLAMKDGGEAVADRLRIARWPSFDAP